MSGWSETQATAVAFGAVAGVAGPIALLWGRRSLLPLERLKPGGWTGAGVFAQLLYFDFARAVAASLAAVGAAAAALPPADAAEAQRFLLVSAGALVLFLAGSMFAMQRVQQTPLGRVGLTTARWRRDVALGALAFLAATPPVLGIHALAQWVFGAGETHPFESLAQLGLSTADWMLFGLLAIVLGPMTEEWLIRGIIQGWLRRATLAGQVMAVWLPASLAFILYKSAGRSADAPTANAGPYLFAAIGGVIYLGGVLVRMQPLFAQGWNAFRDDADVRDPEADDAEDDALEPWFTDLYAAEGEERRAAPWKSLNASWFAWKVGGSRWAIVGSSVAFALVHPWPTPIPLFAFGLVLGWLTSRTQSLLPAMVAHGLFNAVAFVGLALRS